MRITIRGNGSVLVTIPRRASLRLARQFVEAQSAWIARQLSVRYSSEPPLPSYHTSRARALLFVREKVRQWNTHYQLPVARISIRSQSTRWGSCSARGTLSFNYRLLFLPEALADYVVVHELCHIKEMNHSHRFWQLVAKQMPQYLKLRHELRKHHCR